MRAVSRDPDGAGAGVGRLADGGGLAAGPLHALRGRGRARAAALRHRGAARLLCGAPGALYQVSSTLLDYLGLRVF